MIDYRAELDRRIEQFHSYLALMPQRRFAVDGSCFIRFSGQTDSDEGSAKSLVESKKLVRETVTAAFDDGGLFSSVSGENPGFQSLPDDGWREDDSQLRFVQVAFRQTSICLDLPLQTLFRSEAEQILSRRLGSFYLRDRPDFPRSKAEVERFNPFQKVYVNGDEQSVAEDIAYIWFKVWKFPVDWRLYVKSAAFKGYIAWERDKPIE